MSQKYLLKSKDAESYELVEGPISVPKEGEALIRVERVALCGSDIALYKWNEVGRAIAKLPFTPGHEAAGVVEAIGPNVTEVTVGDRVAVENHFYCGTCYQCTHDQKHICQRMDQYGHGKGSPHGGCAQYSIVPSRCLYKLRSNIDMDLAALLEPCGVAHHAVTEVGVEDDTVMVIGCGPIGLVSLAIAKTFNAKLLIAVDILDSHLALAKEMGADIVVNPTKEDLPAVVMQSTNGDGVGAIIEASGAMASTCFSMLRKGGRVLLVGLPKQPLHVANVLQDVVFKSLTLKTIHGRKIFDTWIQTEKLLADGKINVQPIISHRLGMSQYEEAFAALVGGTATKIVLNPWN